jgi:hypothetical protein
LVATEIAQLAPGEPANGYLDGVVGDTGSLTTFFSHY